MARRVLLTGGSGLIGLQVAPLLKLAGYEVHAVRNRQDPGVSAAESGVVWHEMDLLGSGAVSEIVSRIKPSGLVHLAWSAAPGNLNDAINLLWSEASKQLIRCFYECGGERALIAGTCFEYDLSEGVCSEEGTPLVGNALYGKSKVDLYTFTRNYCNREGLCWSWGRIFFVYGPREHPDRLVPSVIVSLLKNQPARCTHGRQVRDYLHSRDVAAGLVRLFESGWVGECNIASGMAVTLRSIAEEIADRVGGRDLLEFGAKPAPEGEPPVILAEVTRLRDTVGWKPSMTLGQGLDDTIDWWRRKLASSEAA